MVITGFCSGKKAALSEYIEKKYAAELAKANPIQKHQIRKQMVEEYLRRGKIEGHKPSAGHFVVKSIRLDAQ